MSIDVIGDFLTIIRNGVMVAKPSVSAPHSNMRQQIATLLKEQGFVKNVSVNEDAAGKKVITVDLKYVGGESVIHEIERVSRPSRREYTGAKNIKPVIGGLGVTILSTSHGVMTQQQAKKDGVGGEVLCTIW